MKVGISEAGQTEYFWLDSLVEKDGRFSATINNTPQMVTRVRRGQRYGLPAFRNRGLDLHGTGQEQDAWQLHHLRLADPRSA